MPLRPFLIFPWQRSFLPELKKHIEKITNGHCGSATVIIPNQRPVQHLYREFMQDKKCAMLPRVLTFSEVITLWNANLPESREHMATELDQVALLEKCVNDIAGEDPLLAEKFAGMSMGAFLPWGMRLAALFEDIFIKGREAENLHHLEHEVADPGHALLASLGKIGSAYHKALAEKNWTTPGYAQYLAIKNSSKIPPMLQPTEERQIIVAGFSVLNGAENTLLKSLYNQGAEICLHSDPNLVSGNGFNWAASPHANWIGEWHAKTDLAVTDGFSNSPEIYFFSGYDAHSQLLQMRGDITEKRDGPSAIVLLDDSMLMPVLHTLEGQKTNPTMGYPISRLPFIQLLRAIFSLHANMTGAGHYWKEVLAILNHPYIQSLKGEGLDGSNFKKALSLLDREIRKKSKYINIDKIFMDCFEAVESPIADFLQQFKELVFNKAAEIASLFDFTQFIEEFVDFFNNYGSHIWIRHLKDAEAMDRLMGSILPPLKINELVKKPLELASILEIYDRLVAGERIPFHTDDDAPLQIMGMLETRLLNFDRVFIIDATDGALPGAMPRDPLLPNYLRSALGLQDSKSREKTMLYNLHRLCAGAKEVYFYWREGGSSSNILDGKNYRSRFIENLVWEREKIIGDILTPENGNLKIAQAPVVLHHADPKPIIVNEALKQKVGQFLKQPVSSSKLEEYVACPLKFAFGNLLKLSEPNTVPEGDDPLLSGTLVHKALQIHLQPYIGKKLDFAKIADKKALQKSFKTALAEEKRTSLLPPHSFLYLQKSFFLNIAKYMRKMPEHTGIFDLEYDIGTLELPNTGFTGKFTGKLDRIDERDGKLYILDYKTGLIDKNDQDFWKDAVFFEEAAVLCQDTAGNFQELDQYLGVMAEKEISIQLPLYMAMLRAKLKNREIGNAIHVSLSEQGKEIPFFNNFTDDETKQAINGCEIITGLAINHLANAPSFEAKRSKKCAWCPYADICASA